MAALIAGLLLGFVDSVVNHVPVFLGEVGTARAERGGWSQVAEFASLILDAGWVWAALAVLAGWLASRRVQPVAGLAWGAAAGGLSLLCATAAYYGTDLLFDGGSWWGWVTRYWLIGSVLLGPPLGVVGALIRRGGAIGVVAAIVVPVGAALQMVILPPPAESRMAEPIQWSVWVAAVVSVGLIARSGGRRPRKASALKST
ncbi:DUF6518 family protein [Paractinoplanes lichenicola]|uniref:DUF998 domain-containing protein n=1 Tax=Paractinoplanes lichenicola TaxID=2802976 RepID=A0ABS1VEG1_9ACTN|nr:DUF6518 family protein [Actinoplanes lichenicola]MBL7253069.1 hypothetical protein [Actinoplanes lichenicola]